MNMHPLTKKWYRSAVVRLFGSIAGSIIGLSSVTCTSTDTTIAGSGSQAGNGRITCVVHYSDGSTVSNAAVFLRSNGYTAAPDSEKAKNPHRNEFTDANGMVYIDSVDTGTYCIEVNDGEHHAVLLTCSVTQKDTLVALPDDTLFPTGTITAALSPLPDDSAATYIAVYGLERIAAYDTARNIFTINDVPRGSYTLSVVPSSESYSPIDIDGIIAVSDETTDVGSIDLVTRSVLPRSMRLYVNTSLTGANLPDTITEFPVLVRLRAENFDFSRATSDGGDVRFTKPDGKLLGYEIELWDPIGQHADVWVSLDTVYGNDSTHYFVMSWGNPEALDGANSEKVFDTANSVAAVWHLNYTSSDATSGNNDGVASSASDTAGLIGSCKKFNGTDSITIPGLLGTPSSVTLSAWVRLDSTTPGGGSDIVSIGDAVILRNDYDLDSIGTAGMVHLSENRFYYNVISKTFLKRSGWHFVAFTLDYASVAASLYIDGVKVASRTDLPTAINYSGVGVNTYIGKHGNGKNEFGFFGCIDEVRVYRKAVTPGYIKLSYMNQKAKDVLIDFR